MVMKKKAKERKITTKEKSGGAYVIFATYFCQEFHFSHYSLPKLLKYGPEFDSGTRRYIWLRLLLLPVLAPRGFSPVTPVFWGAYHFRKPPGWKFSS